MSIYQNIIQHKFKTSGVGDFLYFAPISDFADGGISCVTPPTPPAVHSLDSSVTITADHTFATGGYFRKVLCAPHKNNLTAAGIGEAGSMKLDTSIQVFLPGSKKDLHGTVKQMMQDSFIALIKDAECEEDQWYQLGCDCIFATVSAVEYTSGTTKEGQKGYSITLNCPSSAIFIYEGEVQTTPEPEPDPEE